MKMRKMTFDTNLYSRQMYAMGRSAMEKLREAKVLISGIGSVGLEISKNLILAGIGHVSIHDTKAVSWNDLSAQFYVTENDIGKNRAEASFLRLQELNDSVQCTCLKPKPLSEDDIKDFDLVIVTDANFDSQLEIDGWVRTNGKRLISSDARGLFAYVFVDFGLQFCITDENGEACKEVILEHINCETGDVYTLGSTMHGFEDGDHVAFSEVVGASELNSLDPVPIRVTNSYTFNIGTAAKNSHPYIEGGRAKQVKVPKHVDFKTLQESLKNPDFLVWDFAKFDSPPQMHLLWQALYIFEKKFNRSPYARAEEDAELLGSIMKAMNTDGLDIPEKLIQTLSFQARGNLQPMASVVGGIVAQEAMKAVTGHTTPLKQFLYIDCSDALPGPYSTLNADNLKPRDCEARNSRYDGQAAVFGWSFQEALFKQKWFVVGAGAIGCELLKNMAMMGLGCDLEKKGKLVVTDMDTIEISNLSRQFLFRRKDVGSKKSEVAASAVKQFNAQMNILPLGERVSSDTEHVFSAQFFKDLTGVANALDNVEARLLVDGLCVYYQLPLLESGTMGTKGNTQVVYPHLTESYGSSRDPPEKETPMCTLKNFPYEINHTIQWARAKFEDLFTSPAEITNQYISDKNGFLERLGALNLGQKIERLKTVSKALIDERPLTAAACIFWARKLFEEFYCNEIAQLVFVYPPNHMTEHGVKFWSGTKRCPVVLTFDSNEENHIGFVYAASILRAQQYGLEPILSVEEVKRLASSYEPPKFVPRSGVRIAVNEAEAARTENEILDDDSPATVNFLTDSLARLEVRQMNALNSINFEKDDDTNHHVDFVASASNLRAYNYNIVAADKIKTKQIAGKIIPALATTTSVIAGLSCLELYKMVEVDGKHSSAPIERFKNAFVNLALPFFAFSEPIASPIKKYGEKTFTLWDRLEVDGPKTLSQLIKYVEAETGLEVSMISSGVALIYASFQPRSVMNDRLARDVLDVVEVVSRRSVPEHKRSLVFEVQTQNEKEEDIEIPIIKYNIPEQGN